MAITKCRVRLLTNGGYGDEEYGETVPQFPVLVEAEHRSGSKLVHVAGSTLYRIGFRVEGIGPNDNFMYGFFLNSEAEIVGPEWAVD